MLMEFVSSTNDLHKPENQIKTFYS